jgi:hypothetical protein
MPRSGSNSRANELASQLAALPYLEAVILGGSIQRACLMITLTVTFTPIPDR